MADGGARGDIGPSAGIDFSKHPAFGESLIPVWGPGREAVADVYDGDYLGAAGNTALAVSDVWLASAASKAIVKSIVRAAGNAARATSYSTTWAATQKRMKDSGYIPDGHAGHHWLIPQSRWGKKIPESIKNAHWNTMPLEKTVHSRIHHRVGEVRRYNPIERFIRGTPAAVKVAAGSAGGIRRP